MLIQELNSTSLLSLKHIHSDSFYLGCEVFICDFHRKQSWDRWLKKLSNGCFSRKDDFLTILRHIAWSKSSEEEEIAVRILELSDFH